MARCRRRHTCWNASFNTASGCNAGAVPRRRSICEVRDGDMPRERADAGVRAGRLGRGWTAAAPWAIGWSACCLPGTLPAHGRSGHGLQAGFAATGASALAWAAGGIRDRHGARTGWRPEPSEPPGTGYGVSGYVGRCGGTAQKSRHCADAANGAPRRGRTRPRARQASRPRPGGRARAGRGGIRQSVRIGVAQKAPEV